MSLNLSPYHIRLSGHSSQEAFNKHLANQINNALKLIERTAFGSQTQIVQTASASGTAASSAAATKSTNQVTVIQNLLAGVSTPITFSAPSQIRSYPTCWTSRDGSYGPVGFTPDYTSIPHGFTITADADSTMYMTYEPL